MTDQLLSKLIDVKSPNEYAFLINDSKGNPLSFPKELERLAFECYQSKNEFERKSILSRFEIYKTFIIMVEYQIENPYEIIRKSRLKNKPFIATSMLLYPDRTEKRIPIKPTELTEEDIKEITLENTNYLHSRYIFSKSRNLLMKYLKPNEAGKWFKKLNNMMRK